MRATEQKARHRLATLALFLVPCCLASMMLGLSGCLMVGYSSRGGAFIWPGGLGFLILLAILFFFLRGRR